MRVTVAFFAAVAVAMAAWLILPILGSARAASPAADGRAEQMEIQIERQPDGLTVKADGGLFFRYVVRGSPKPYCWPVVGPTGDRMTRAYPVQRLQGEAHDHPHQRSLWFTHGDVNGVDFWSETDRSGRQVHRRFELVEGGAVGRIKAVTDWVRPDGRKVCEDVRTLTVRASARSRVIDFEITVRASEGPLRFGDTKEGSFGLRVASSMRVDRGGHIVNSRGQTDKAAWGRPAEWVDYSGLVNGKRVGIAIMDHPSSFRHPTHWHVRTYGLFAANPFGLHHFYRGSGKDGSYELAAGKSVTFRYRVLFHKGDAKAAGIPEAYRAYAAER